MADNFAMPNQQVPIGSKPAPHAYGDGNEVSGEIVKGIGKIGNAFGAALDKRRKDIAKGRQEHMNEAATAARDGSAAQDRLNEIYAKGATKLARHVLETDNNTDNFLRIGASGLASEASAGRKATSGKFIQPSPATSQPSAVASPAAKPRTRKPAQTKALRTPIEGGGYHETRVPIEKAKELSSLHEKQFGTVNKAPTAKAPAKTPAARATTKPPAAKATANKAPTAKAPASKPPAARKPRAPK